MESTCLEIVRADCKQSPTADLFSHDSHRPSVGEVGVKALLELDGDCKPHAICVRIGWPVP